MTSPRIATDNDVDAIVHLVNEAFLVEQFFIDRNRTDAAHVRSLMEKGMFLLTDEDSELVGCVYAELKLDHGYFGMLSVEPSRQGEGIGSRLVQAVEQYFRDAGCKFSELKIVNVRTELHAMYKQWGYADAGTDPYDDPTPTKIPVHFINMSKPLL
ncbi:MAG TPA: GNAT family N-acetyltransferase [Candidatus Acidoferrales bacterium]|jgi:GNAT superfamily N-acetyltransferase|nr:GNAT family N-acetyltransferase [Candidatus Acidoferrales bacterium]